MADYFNRLNMNIAEMVTFQFNHVINLDNHENINNIAELVTTVDKLIFIHQFLGDIIKKHEENLTRQKEANKKLS